MIEQSHDTDCIKEVISDRMLPHFLQMGRESANNARPDLPEFHCAVLGSDVEGKSLSPKIRRLIEGYYGVDQKGTYTAKNVDQGKFGEYLKDNYDNEHQFAITTPHKVDALMFALRAGYDVSDAVQCIGAVNTFTRGERRFAVDNTDFVAAKMTIRALKTLFFKEQSEEEKEKNVPLEQKDVLMVGAGGAARAWAQALMSRSVKADIYNSYENDKEASAAVLAKLKAAMSQVERLVSDFNRFHRNEPLVQKPYDVVINATPLGTPKLPRLPYIQPEHIKTGGLVIDLPYNGCEDTPLVQTAKERECTVVNGVELLILQAIEQYRLLVHRYDADFAERVKNDGAAWIQSKDEGLVPYVREGLLATEK